MERKATYPELASLFFATRQLIRSRLPASTVADPNSWLRCETLRFVEGEKSASMQQIATYLRVKAPSATSLVHSLVKEALVERTAQSGDKRVVRIALTKKGRAVLRSYERSSIKALSAVFSKLESHELQQLTLVLRRLHEAHASKKN